MDQTREKYNAGYDQYVPPQYMMKPPAAQPYVVATPQYPIGARINDHLVWSILGCLCCFWPTGIAAIVYSTKVRDSQMLGDTVGAQNASRTARHLNIVTTTIGSVCHALWLIVVIVFFAVGFGLVSNVSSNIDWSGAGMNWSASDTDWSASDADWPSTTWRP